MASAAAMNSWPSRSATTGTNSWPGAMARESWVAPSTDDVGALETTPDGGGQLSGAQLHAVRVSQAALVHSAHAPA